MRLPFLVAMLAGLGSCGVAVAVPMLELAPVEASVSVETPLAPILVLDARPSAVLAQPASQTGEDLVASAKRVLAFEDAGRIDALPRHLLLPDGALVVSSIAPADGEMPLTRGLMLRESPARAPEPVGKPLTIPAAHLARMEDPGVSTYVTGRRASAPEPAPLAKPHVFEPQTLAASGDARAYWAAGGLAFIGAATVLGFALYHRIRPNAALENETRKTIFDAVCAQPGLGVHEIGRLAGVSYSTATYHLERLVGAGMIVMTPDGNKLCYYKNGGAFTETERRILPLVKNEEAAKLFEAIVESPGTYRAALAERLGVTATTINWHLRRLREAGLVDETRAGRSAHLYAKIDTMRPMFSTLALKVEASEPIIAERLRRYAGETSATKTGVGAA